MSELREWSILSDLLTKIFGQRAAGFFGLDVEITCIDVVSDFIALGTNCGLVLWYQRSTMQLQRLPCENGILAIEKIKLVETVDHMIAVADTKGSINIFQVPVKMLPPADCPPHLIPSFDQPIKRYLVDGLHTSAVTTLEWAKNGMKLFSGDQAGCVVQTEIDFHLHICKSCVVINEPYRIVQISYRQQILLVSTLDRCIVCTRTSRNADQWQLQQVGTKDRKLLGEFGGVIWYRCDRPNDMRLYCSRPGLRIWQADRHGQVLKTLRFKDLSNFNSCCTEVPTLGRTTGKREYNRLYTANRDPSFGRLLVFDDAFLVTHNSKTIYVLNPDNLTLVYTVNSCQRILDVCTFRDELFVLEEPKNIIRIAFRPEPCYGQPVNDISMATSMIDDMAQKLNRFDLSRTFETLMSTSLYAASDTFVSKVNSKSSASVVIEDDIEEAHEVDIVDDLNLRSLPIKKDDHDEIVYKRQVGNRKRKTNSDMTTSQTSNTIHSNTLCTAEVLSDEDNKIQTLLPAIYCSSEPITNQIEQNDENEAVQNEFVLEDDLMPSTSTAITQHTVQKEKQNNSIVLTTSSVSSDSSMENALKMPTVSKAIRMKKVKNECQTVPTDWMIRDIRLGGGSNTPRTHLYTDRNNMHCDPSLYDWVII